MKSKVIIFICSFVIAAGCSEKIEPAAAPSATELEAAAKAREQAERDKAFLKRSGNSQTKSGTSAELK